VAVPESLLHDLALAAWDEGADAGMAWDPDADPAKRGVVPCTPEEGIAKARDHFAKHGSGSPSSAFSRALQAIRENSRSVPAGRVLERAAWLTIDEMANALVLEFGTPLAAARGFAKAIADASIAKGSRAIPADRVLGEGMVAVDADELRALERVRMEAEYVKDAFQQMGEFSQMEGIMRALHELDSLRANQGGAAT